MDFACMASYILDLGFSDTTIAPTIIQTLFNNDITNNTTNNGRTIWSRKQLLFKLSFGTTTDDSVGREWRWSARRRSSAYPLPMRSLRPQLCPNSNLMASRMPSIANAMISRKAIAFIRIQ